MKIDFNILVILLLVGTVHGFITTLVLLRSKHNRRANRLLALLVLGFSLQAADYFLNKAGIYIQHGEYYFLPIYYSLGFGPLLYFYVRTLTKPAAKFQPLALLHFIPVFIQFVFYAFISIRSLPYKTYFWLHVHQPFTQKVELYTSIISVGIYLGLSLYLLQNYQKKINNYFSDTKSITLKWLKSLLLGLFILYAAWLMEHIFTKTPFGLLEVLLPIYIYWIAWMGYQQKSTAVSQLAQGLSSTKEKPQPEISPAAVLLIQNALAEKKLYLNASLTLIDLANQVNIPPKQVSFIINSHFGKSFNSFVNQYRVEEFKSKLATNSNNRFTILGLALDSGFNSQASFYRIFREVTGVSPKEYLINLSENA